jgi:hypothetical protein
MSEIGDIKNIKTIKKLLIIKMATRNLFSKLHQPHERGAKN